MGREWDESNTEMVEAADRVKGPTEKLPIALVNDGNGEGNVATGINWMNWMKCLEGIGCRALTGWLWGTGIEPGSMQR